MQLICEAYALFKHAGFTTDEMAAIFDRVERGRAAELPHPDHRASALEQRDPETGKPVVDSSSTRPARRAPASGRCSTRRERVVISTINAAVEARMLSSMKEAARRRQHPAAGPANAGIDRQGALVKKVHDALYAPRSSATRRAWTSCAPWARRRLGPRPGRRIAASGAAAASSARASSTASPRPTAPTRPRQPDAGDPFFRDVLNRTQQNWREVVALAVAQRHPGAGLQRLAGYYDSYRAPACPPTCSRPSATSSAPTPTSAPTSPRASVPHRTGRR
jgi:6-phosphogluconate dehydrogenase